MRDPQLAGKFQLQAPVTMEVVSNIHASVDSTANKISASRMLVPLCGDKYGWRQNVSMSKVSTRFKATKPRHFIREWRKHRGLSQEELADRIGATHGAVSQLERGLINYTQPMLEALAGALACSPADLLMRDPSDPDGLWSIWDQAQPGERRQIVEIAKTLIKTGTD